MDVVQLLTAAVEQLAIQGSINCGGCSQLMSEGPDELNPTPMLFEFCAEHMIHVWCQNCAPSEAKHIMDETLKQTRARFN